MGTADGTRRRRGRHARPATVRLPATVLNPLRSEGEAFRFLLYAIAVIVAIVLLVLLLRAVL
jgi:hypothetical protein